jgi:hypothetical protein
VGVGKVTVRPTTLGDPQPAVSFASLSLPGGNGTLGGGAVYEAVLDGPQGTACSPGPRPQAYTLTLSRREAGAAAPVSDLETYLGAPMHLATIASDLTYAGHTHGTLPKAASCSGTATGAGGDGTARAALAAPAGEHAAHGRRLLLASPARRTLAQATIAAGSGHGDQQHDMDGMDMDGMDMGDAEETGGAGAAPPHSGGAGAAAEHAQHAAPAGARFGPVVLAEAPMPRAGVYALVAQLRRGKELILLPFYVNCSGPAQPAT